MKFLLTSAGIKNASINDALVDLISGQEPRCPMCELGWKSLGVLELSGGEHGDGAQRRGGTDPLEAANLWRQSAGTG